MKLKRFILCLVLVFVIGIFLTSCTVEKTGQAGPRGSPGISRPATKGVSHTASPVSKGVSYTASPVLSPSPKDRTIYRGKETFSGVGTNEKERDAEMAALRMVVFRESREKRPGCPKGYSQAYSRSPKKCTPEIVDVPPYEVCIEDSSSFTIDGTGTNELDAKKNAITAAKNYIDELIELSPCPDNCIKDESSYTNEKTEQVYVKNGKFVWCITPFDCAARATVYYTVKHCIEKNKKYKVTCEVEFTYYCLKDS